MEKPKTLDTPEPPQMMYPVSDAEREHKKTVQKKRGKEPKDHRPS